MDFITNTDEIGDVEYEAIRRVISHKVDGVIIYPTQKRVDIFDQ